jgi:hypothetical protein
LFSQALKKPHLFFSKGIMFSPFFFFSKRKKGEDKKQTVLTTYASTPAREAAAGGQAELEGTRQEEG